VTATRIPFQNCPGTPMAQQPPHVATQPNKFTV